MPQKQPPASTAVCSPFDVASRASSVGLGKAPANDELTADTLVVLQAFSVRIKAINIRRLEDRSKVCLSMFVFHRPREYTRISYYLDFRNIASDEDFIRG